VIVVMVFVTTIAAPRARGEDDAGEKRRILLSTTMGDITLELAPDKAPITVENFVAYVEAGYYDGTVFHRVIPNFMIQGGGLDKDLKEKAGGRPPIKNESDNGLRNKTGTVAMARTSAPDSATSQFFINVSDNAFLDRTEAGVGYTVFGKVVEGMKLVEKMGSVNTTSKGVHRDVPVEPIVLNSAKLLDDAGAEAAAGGEKPDGDGATAD
jgi:cyclophilin family peptidyl-prolyl cis-trans isomerase